MDIKALQKSQFIANVNLGYWRNLKIRNKMQLE